MTVSVRELKGKLARYLKRAAAGEDVTVTSRGRSIARLIPAAPQDEEREPDAAELRRRIAAIPGIILGKPGPLKGSPCPTRVRKGQKRIADIMIADRC